MASEALDQMIVEFIGKFDSLTNAPSVIGEAFDRVASVASETASEISNSIEAASEGFSKLTDAAQIAGIDIGDGLAVSYEALDELGSVSEETATTVSESLSSVNFDGFQSALSSLTEAVDAAVSQINEKLATIPDKAKDDAEKSKSAFDGFSLGGMINQIGLSIFSFQNMANMATQLASGLLQPAMNAENMQESFTNLTGSAQAASDELSKLDAFAAQTQFTTMDIDQAGAQLLGFGFKASSIIPDIKAVGDNLSAVGKGTPAEVQSVIDIFGKMATQGKLTQMDINELGTHGIKALQDIAAGAGLSTKQIQEMIAKGTLPAKTAIDDLTKGIEMNPIYAGGMAKQADTLSGITSTLSSDWDQFMATIMKPALPLLEQGLTKLTTLLIDPNFQKFATTMGVDLVNAIVTVTTDVGNLINTGENVVNFFKNNQDAMNALIAVLISGAGVIGGVLLPMLLAWAVDQWLVAAPVIATAAPFIALGIVVAAVIFGIIEAVQHAGQIAAWFQGIWAAAAQFWHDDVSVPFQSAVKDVEDAFTGFGKIVSAIWNGIGNTVKGGINDIIGGINDFIGFIDSFQIHIPAIGVGPVHTPAFDWNGLGIPKIPMLSGGGTVPPGGVAIAGDPGPNSELVFGGTSGASVLSHAMSMNALQQAGSGKTEIHNHIYIDGREITNQVMVQVMSQIRSSGHPLQGVA